MPVTEKRTQIYLTAGQHRRASELASRRGVSLAAVIRDALDRYLSAEESESETNWEGDPALALLGGFNLPPPAKKEKLNDSIDRVLYDRDGR